MFLAKRKVALKSTFKVALTSLFGIGSTRFRNLQIKLGSSRNLTLKQLSLTKRKGLSTFIDKYTLSGPLKKLNSSVLRSHIDCGSYKGLRMKQGLPANGQRTRSNASTARCKIQIASLIKTLTLAKKERTTR